MTRPSIPSRDMYATPSQTLRPSPSSIRGGARRATARRRRTAALLVALAVVGVLLVAALGAAPPKAGTSPGALSLTFDDGVADQYQARPMLSSRGMKGTFYINSGRIGTSGYMTRQQIMDLQNDGNEIGGHTVSHADLPTVDTVEQQRQICNDRQQLLSLGFNVSDFAYPYGDYDAGSEKVVQDCGYNNARSVGGLVSPGSCNGCAFAESIPPADNWAAMTPDSVKSDTSLATLKGFVTQAQQHGGGWVPIVMHHVCDGPSCDIYSISSTTFSQFLDWLATQPTKDLSVKTVHDVIGGTLKPGVPGPAPAPAAAGTNLIQNPSLETDANADQVPDCFLLGGFGTNT